MSKLTAREILIRFAKQYNNNWEATFEAIKEKKPVPDDVPDNFGDWTPITLLDNNYPERFKQGVKPPFVFFTKGKMENLADNMLLLIAPKNCSEYNGIDRMFTELRNNKVPVVVHWKNRGVIHNGVNYAREAIRAYAHSEVPFVVILDADTENLETVANQVVFVGGLAITERCPRSGEAAGVLPAARLTPLLAKAALLLGGRCQDDAELDLNYALNAGIDIGALTWPAFLLDGKLCARAVQEGATLVADEKDVLDLLKGNL